MLWICRIDCSHCLPPAVPVARPFQQDLICQGEGALPVLRLLLLYCAVHGGIPKRHFDNLRCVCLPTLRLAGWFMFCLAGWLLVLRGNNLQAPL